MPELNPAKLPQNLHAARVFAARGAGLAQLAGALGGQIVNVVEGMHGTIARTPLPLAKLSATHTTGITGLVYKSIHQSFALATGAVGIAARTLNSRSAEPETPAWTRLRAALNGVCGDALHTDANPLAQPMELRSADGVLVSQYQSLPGSGPLLLFAHGLCMSDIDWHEDPQPAFVAWCQSRLQAQPVYLRYNSGLAIAENGRRLSALLEHLMQKNPGRELIIVGHSMGGLLGRSALLSAATSNHQWPQQLSHLACVGSPHEGSHWERLGEYANGLLKNSPYTAPFYLLGNLRSAGIQNLRDGHIGETTPLSSLPARQQTTKVLFLAATRSTEGAKALRDDKLVPVASALSKKPDGGVSVAGAIPMRHTIYNTDHFDLIWKEASYALLRQWLSAAAAAEQPARRPKNVASPTDMPLA